jgi:glycine cleavage system H protein
VIRRHKGAAPKQKQNMTGALLRSELACGPLAISLLQHCFMEGARRSDGRLVEYTDAKHFQCMQQEALMGAALSYPGELKYVKSHEYVRAEAGIATIGITAFAADQLGDVTYVELPKVGSKFKLDQKFGVVESVKSVSDLFMPVSGEVIEINDRLSSEPELINHDCYGDGWMLKVKLDNSKELEQTLSADQYKEFIVD